MQSAVDDTLRSQAEQYRFRFTCEHCSQFDEQRASCAYGFPTEPHRAIDLAARSQIEFCKAFELD